MDRNIRIFVILIIVVSVIVLILTGVAIYFAIQKDGNSGKNITNEQISQEDEEERIENKTVENQIENKVSEEINNTQLVENISNDIEKLLFNSKLNNYMGDITGEQLTELFKVCQENATNEHTINISSQTVNSLEEIVKTDFYTITFEYDSNGYINKVMFEKKI